MKVSSINSSERLSLNQFLCRLYIGLLVHCFSSSPFPLVRLARERRDHDERWYIETGASARLAAAQLSSRHRPRHHQLRSRSDAAAPPQHMQSLQDLVRGTSVFSLERARPQPRRITAALRKTLQTRPQETGLSRGQRTGAHHPRQSHLRLVPVSAALTLPLGGQNNATIRAATLSRLLA
jgi:hypothetical protein